MSGRTGIINILTNFGIGALYHPPPCIITRRCASGSSPRSLPQALMASPPAVEGAMTATVVLTRLPPRRTPRLPPQTPRAPAPCLPRRHHHAAVDERCSTATSPTRTHQVMRRRRRRRMGAPPGRAPATRHTRMAAIARPTSAHSTAVSLMSLYFVNKIFTCKTRVSVMI